MKTQLLIIIFGLSALLKAEAVEYRFEGRVGSISSSDNLFQFNNAPFFGILSYDNELLPYSNIPDFSVTAGVNLSMTIMDNLGQQFYLTIDNGSLAILNDIAKQDVFKIMNRSTGGYDVGTTIATNIPFMSEDPTLHAALTLIDFDNAATLNGTLPPEVEVSLFDQLVFSVSTHVPDSKSSLESLSGSIELIERVEPLLAFD